MNNALQRSAASPALISLVETARTSEGCHHLAHVYPRGFLSAHRKGRGLDPQHGHRHVPVVQCPLVVSLPPVVLRRSRLVAKPPFTFTPIVVVRDVGYARRTSPFGMKRSVGGGRRPSRTGLGFRVLGGFKV
jgi:hypothetical protein